MAMGIPGISGSDFSLLNPYQTFFVLGDDSSTSWARVGTRMVSIATPPTPTQGPSSDQVATSWNGILYYGFGYDGTNDYSHMWSYNPLANGLGWIPLADAPAGLEQPGFQAVNGKLYAFCGNTGGSAVNTQGVYEYNIATNAWATKGNAPILNGSHGSCTYGGVIYMLGGFQFSGLVTLQSLYRYDPNSDTWVQLANHPNANGLSFPTLIGHSGFLWAIGGRDGNSGNPVNAVARYNIARNTWTSMRVFPITIEQAAAVIMNNRIYVYGGDSTSSKIATKNVYFYDITNDSWVQDSLSLSNTNDSSGLNMGVTGPFPVGLGGA